MNDDNRRIEDMFTSDSSERGIKKGIKAMFTDAAGGRRTYAEMRRLHG